MGFRSEGLGSRVTGLERVSRTLQLDLRVRHQVRPQCRGSKDMLAAGPLFSETRNMSVELFRHRTADNRLWRMWLHFKKFESKLRLSWALMSAHQAGLRITSVGWGFDYSPFLEKRRTKGSTNQDGDRDITSNWVAIEELHLSNNSLGI